MPAAKPPPDLLTDRASMGLRLRTIRKAQALTLKQLSQRSGVALSTLSKMELGQVSISYEKFAAVARALEVDIARLFGMEPRHVAAGDRPAAVRSSPDEAPGYRTSTYDYKVLAGDFPARHMTPVYGRILARRLEDFDDYVRHAGQEFLMVVSGRLRIQFENGESLTLGKRECAYFDSGIGHVYLSLSREAAEIMVVMTEG